MFRYDEMKEQILSMDAIEIAKKYIDLKTSGGAKRVKTAPCPIHNNTEAGRFFVWDDGYKCFSCGAGGDIINLYSELHGIGYFEAMNRLAVELGLMGPLDRIKRSLDYVGDNDRVQKEKGRGRVNNRGIKETNIELADREIIDLTYRSLLSHLPLTDIHRGQLEKRRKISKKDIEKIGFKSLAQGDNYSKQIIRDLNKQGVSYKVLAEVPGFFQYNNSKDHLWQHLNYNGILIPIRDIDGYIIGLQLRQDTVKEGYNRYMWFSSSFAIDNPRLRNGSSIGSPINVEICKDNPIPTIFITEGVFKSQKIIERFEGVSVISIQGINNWKGISNRIREIEKEIGRDCNINIAFDSDSQENIAVLQQLKSLRDELAEEFPQKADGDIDIISWSTKYKGIDDLIINNQEHTIEVVGYKDLVNRYSELEVEREKATCVGPQIAIQ